MKTRPTPGLTFTLLKTDAQAEGYANVLSHCYARPVTESRKWVGRYARDHVGLLVDPRDSSPGSVAAGLIFLDMGHAYGGRFVPGLGIAGVGVGPEHRGHGAATLLMDSAVKHTRSLGVPLSGLYPATQALYRRSGYEQAGHRCQLKIPLSKIDSRERTLKLRAATPEDRPEIHRVYETWSATCDGALRRSEVLWRRAEMAPPTREETNRCFVVEGERTSKRGPAPIVGYLYMNMPPGEGGKPEVHVHDMVALSSRAGRRLWSFIASHSTICTDLVWYCTPAHPMVSLLPEQSYKLSLQMYWMLRIVDAAKALEARGYPAGLHAELGLDLRDPLIKANSGRLVLRVSDGEASVRHDARKKFSGPVLGLGIDALATLYSGFQPAGQLRFMDRVTGPDRAVELAAALFGGQTPAMCEMF